MKLPIDEDKSWNKQMQANKAEKVSSKTSNRTIISLIKRYNTLTIKCSIASKNLATKAIIETEKLTIETYYNPRSIK